MPEKNTAFFTINKGKGKTTGEIIGNYTDKQIPHKRRECQEYYENQYIYKIKGIAPLSEAEELELLTQWHELRDLKARNRVVEANLRLVLPIAKATTKRFRFLGAKFMPCYLDFIAAGSVGLVAAADYFDPGSGHKFEHYARRCISRECIRAAKRLLSVVDRPYYAQTPADILLDMSQPDPVPAEEYCGSRARQTTGSDRQDKPLGSVHANLRPWPKDWEVRFQKEEGLGARIHDLRKAGLTLKETADKLGLSTTTVWRRQQAYMEARYA